jgi:hypothetical protein
MEGSRLLRFLRIAVTAFSLTACLLLTMLWVRSYHFMDAIAVRDSPTRMLIFNSFPGYIEVTWNSNLSSPPGPWVKTSIRLTDMNRQLLLPPTIVRFGCWLEPQTCSIRFPHWFFVLLFAALAALPWIKWRFSLRTLLIATTLVAVGLAAIVYASR